jgi:hypothetical protein
VHIEVEVLDGLLMAKFVQTIGDGLVRRPTDDFVEDPQADAGTSHYAAFSRTGAILPTTSVFCSSA